MSAVAKNRCEIKPAADRHADRGHHEQGGRRGQAGHQIVPIVQDGARPDETDAGNDLRGDPGVVAGVAGRQCVRKQSKHRAPRQINMIRTQAGRADA